MSGVALIELANNLLVVRGYGRVKIQDFNYIQMRKNAAALTLQIAAREAAPKLKAMLEGVITVWKLTSLDSVQRSQWRTGPPQQRV